MSVAHPELPGVPEYPTEQSYDTELNAAATRFESELTSVEGWDDQGERDEVQLYSKPDPNDPYGVPTVKGECIVKACTSDQFLATIQLPGMRKRWDSRFESGHMLARFSRTRYSFYTEMKGMGWLVYPRDIVGVHKTFREAELGKEIRVVQTSVVNDELAPAQSGKTRATLHFSGWQLLPIGEDLKVIYIVKVELNGSIPLALVRQIATETPLCTGRARDVFQTLGHAPFVHVGPGQSEAGVVFQTEQFSFGDELTYTCTFTPAKGALFDILYDTRRMYAMGGVATTVARGSGAELIDDGKGTITVRCERDGEAVTITLAPKT